MNYDIIGDVHGRYDDLVELLKKLGYRESSKGWHKSGHMAIFLGDLVDGGLQQVKTVNLVRRMVEHNDAHCIMGNHEFNAIAWETPDPDEPGEFLRKHTSQNQEQHQAFLNEVVNQPIHGELIQWFKTLPLWMDFGQFRVIHACWHEPSMTRLKQNNSFKEGCLHGVQWINSSRNGHPDFIAVEMLCKGPEVKLPENYYILDRKKNKRKQMRIKWWGDDFKSYREAALIPSPQMDKIPDAPLVNRPDFIPYIGPPVFFGHYGLLGQPELFSEKIACVDFSHEDRKLLTAYQWGGEDTLIQNNIIYIEPNESYE